MYVFAVGASFLFSQQPAVQHMFDINITLGIQFLNFIITIVVLDLLLIRPIRGIVKKRRDFASGMLSDAEQFTTEAADKLDKYESALAKAREEAARIRDAKKGEGVLKEGTLLQGAQTEAQQFLQSSRESTRVAVSQAMADMETRVPELAAKVVDRLLGKSTPSAAA